MARYSDYDTTLNYEAADRFRDRCLQQNASLLRDDDAPLWTLENLATLHRVFVAAPDEGDRSFIDKFRDQVTPAGPLIVRLAAEMLCVYFLFPSNVGGPRKRELVNEVLGWAGDALTPDNLISRAFEFGIGSAGQAYNQRRPFEIALLIDFTIAWKGIPASARAAALADPWIFEGRVDEIDGADTRQIRHILLHLLFPDSFERIASGRDKKRILAAFDGLVTEPPDDDDKHLLEIRERLQELLPQVEELDFYWPPLASAWSDSGDGGDDFAPLDVIRYKKQIVLYGPPGTGKTYRAAQIAARIIRSSALLGMGASRYFEEVNAIDNAVEANIHRLQLHSAYTYEDFIGGMHLTKEGSVFRPGYFLRLLKRIEGDNAQPSLPHVLILDEINRTDLSRLLGECFSLLENRNQRIELSSQDDRGQPIYLSIPANLYVIGTMNLIDQSIEQIDFALRRRFFWFSCPFDKEALMSACESRWKDAETNLDWAAVQSDFAKLGTAAAALNSEIRSSALLGPQYEIGHTYLLDVVSFLREELGPRPRARRYYLWRRDWAAWPVQQVWRLSLRPLVEEYLSGLETATRESELSRLENVFLAGREAQ